MDYKEKLEEAKKLYESANADQKYVLESLFPELRESEDEKIRKEIVNFIELPHPQFVGKRDHEKWIAWLEKQGEQKPNPCDGCINRKGCINCENGELREVEQKPTDEEMKELLRTEYEKGRADAIAEMQNLAWSEEDEWKFSDIMALLRGGENCHYNTPELFEWFKTIKDRVQPKQKWSGEDERMCQETIDWFEKKCFPYALEHENPARESIKWLKSLKQRIGG